MGPNFEPLPLKTLGEKIGDYLSMIAVAIGLLVILIVVAAVGAAAAFGAPIYEGRGETVTVTLTDEPCTVAAVSNLPRRATWTERGKVFEGCYEMVGGVVVMYFAEYRTVILAPRGAFQPVSGI